MTSIITSPPAARRAFFTALYAHAPDDLLLELRAIHPTTHQACSFWAAIGDKGALLQAFVRAEALNKEGFGVYFAPCLRHSQQGSAEAAALVPALWIDLDCEGDEARREAGLAVLKDFDCAPSFVIDSGGGWHGYWLLDEPFMLHAEADRQRMAAMLRGLFTVLGGDEAYVKTVAGIMRLPDSVNTKPERGGAVVKIVDGDPERRYALEAFAWLTPPPAPASLRRGAGPMEVSKPFSLVMLTG